MNMASNGILILIFIGAFVIASGIADVFVKGQCKAVNVGHYGQSSMLECVIQKAEDITDVKVLALTWKKDGVKQPRLIFHEEDLVLQPGYSFAEKSWNEKSLNISLLITNTTLLDKGGYTCGVLTNRGALTVHTSLEVTAKYTAPTISMHKAIIQNALGSLRCEAFGGYPEGQLRWFDVDTKDWTKSATMVAEKTESGLFHLSSTLPLLQGSTFSKYTCGVFNASGGKEDEATINMADTEIGRGTGTKPGAGKASIPTSNIVAPVVVIGSLIVGLLLLLVILRRRSQRGHPQFQTCDSNHEDVGQEEMGIESQS